MRRNTHLYGVESASASEELATSKVDVWSLSVTLACAQNVGAFREKHLHTLQQRLTALMEVSQMSPMDSIKEMVIVEPEHTASAAQMLVKLYNGKGLTTPRNRVTLLNTAIKANKSEDRVPSRTRPVYKQVSKCPARTPSTRPVMREQGAVTTRMRTNIFLDKTQRP